MLTDLSATVCQDMKETHQPYHVLDQSNHVNLILTETYILFLNPVRQLIVVCSMSHADHRGRAVNKIFMLIMILGTLFAFFTSVGIDYIHIHKHVLVAALLQPPWPRYLLGLIRRLLSTTSWCLPTIQKLECSVPPFPPSRNLCLSILITL